MIRVSLGLVVKPLFPYVIIPREGLFEEFHVYGLEWTPEYVEYFFDGESVCKYCKGTACTDCSSQYFSFPLSVTTILMSFMKITSVYF